MTEEELRDLLAYPESEVVECKPGIPSRREIAEYAVGIGNSGGGWLIMGVSDRVPRTILSAEMPSPEEMARIRESVADSAQIHISLEIVPTSDGPILAAGMPSRPRGIPFHTRDGKYLIRLGDGLRGMTLEQLDAIRREGGDELSARMVDGEASGLLSAAGMEELRRLMQEAGAPPELLHFPDLQLLRALGVLSNDRLLIAGLLLAGRADALRTVLPRAQWQFRRMKSDTDYDQAEDGYECFPLALKRLRELVAANNPIVTIPGWLVHPEFPRYPALALRELIVNALAHRDYETPGAVTLKLYPDRLELSNPGGFIGGVTPQNILHHPSSPRYPALFNALARMRLANAANLGVPRIYRDLLAEGKEPPAYWCSAHTVRVTVKGQQPRKEFLQLVKDHPGMNVDDLLVVHCLTRHREITARTTAEICQRSMEDSREILGALVNRWKLLESGGGSGRGRYYRLSRSAYEALVGTLSYHVDQRIALEDAKARVLAALASGPLANSDVREITRFSRHQCFRLLNELREEGTIELKGSRRAARWHLCKR